eukprot:COSAG02_NODE_1144_length_14244_cov_16.832096_6_plen_81_part_00
MPIADVDVPSSFARPADGSAVNITVVQNDHVPGTDVNVDSFGQMHVAPAIHNELPSNLRVVVATWLGRQRALGVHALWHC